MDAKEKALKIFLGAVVALAALMVVYYYVAMRRRTTQNDLNMGDRVEAVKEERAEFAGMYSAADPIEGMDRRVASLTLHRKEDGYYGALKLDRIGSAETADEFLKCENANVAEKDFFVKCESAELGQISFVGEWSRGASGIQVAGKYMWSKEGAVVVEKATTLTHTPAN